MIEVFTEAHTYNWLGESKSIKISTDITVNLVLKGLYVYFAQKRHTARALFIFKRIASLQNYQSW